MTGARRDAAKVTAYFRDAGIDLSKIIPLILTWDSGFNPCEITNKIK